VVSRLVRFAKRRLASSHRAGSALQTTRNPHKRSAEPGSVARASSLVDAAEQAGFELFITADQELSYRQNLTSRKMALMVLSTNNWDFIKAAIARITAVIDAVTPGSYTEVEIPE
jgi:hypothetical protein